jgi:uncharacterized protein (TIRG00374 family)
MTATNRRGRHGLLLGVKAAGTAFLIWFVLSHLSLEEIRAAMKTPRWGWLAASLAVYAVSAFGGAQQWAWILRASGIRETAGEIRRLYFIGLFFNNFLPANIGGDAYKIIDLGRRHERPLAVFCATLLDRLLGLGALTTLAVLGLTAASVGGIPLPPLVLLMIPVLALLCALPAVLLSRRLGARLPAWLRRVGLVRVGDQVARVAAEFAVYRSQVRFLNLVFAFSVLVQLLRMGTHLLVAFGLGYALSGAQMVQLLVLVPVLAIILILPVTINGIGLRETSAAELLTAAGLLAPQAVAMEVAAYLVQVVFSLQGGVLLWLGRGRRPRDPAGGNP